MGAPALRASVRAVRRDGARGDTHPEARPKPLGREARQPPGGGWGGGRQSGAPATTAGAGLAIGETQAAARKREATETAKGPRRRLKKRDGGWVKYDFGVCPWKPIEGTAGRG